MDDNKIKFQTVEEYFSIFPDDIKQKLEKIRQTIKKAVPEANEIISYNMPAFRYYGILVYYAAHKNHIGFYPANTEVLEIFKNKLSAYKTSKGTIQFPYEVDLPISLIKNIVIFRSEQNIHKDISKVKKRVNELK